MDYSFINFKKVFLFTNPIKEVVKEVTRTASLITSRTLIKWYMLTNKLGRL